MVRYDVVGLVTISCVCLLVGWCRNIFFFGGHFRQVQHWIMPSVAGLISYCLLFPLPWSPLQISSASVSKVVHSIRLKSLSSIVQPYWVSHSVKGSVRCSVPGACVDTKSKSFLGSERENDSASRKWKNLSLESAGQLIRRCQAVSFSSPHLRHVGVCTILVLNKW